VSRGSLADVTTYVLRSAVLGISRQEPGDDVRRMFGVLCVLSDLPQSSQQDVGERLLINRTSMVALVDELERWQLAKRMRDPADRRRYLLTATTSGVEYLDRTAAVVSAGDARFLSELESSDRQHLLAVLQTLLSGHRLPDRLWHRVTCLMPMAHQLAMRTTLATLAPLGIQLRHFGILVAVQEAPGCSQVEVAHTFGVTEAAVTQAVDTLVQANLLARSRDPQDRRGYHLELSGPGKVLAGHALDRVLRAEGELLAAVTPEAAAHFRALLRRLAVAALPVA
jgi:DNA-binding MarR family transcriptional regulator